MPCFKFAAWVRSFPLFRGLHFFSRSTRYPAKECALWLRECFWIDVERNEDRPKGATTIDQQPSAVKLWHAMEMLPPVAAMSYKEVEAVGH